jgi:hypothetical protein
MKVLGESSRFQIGVPKGAMFRHEHRGARRRCKTRAYGLHLFDSPIDHDRTAGILADSVLEEPAHSGSSRRGTTCHALLPLFTSFERRGR